MDWQQRLYNELKELTEKISKLEVFICKSSFANLPDIEREALYSQLDVMKAYQRILIRRNYRASEE